jgi:LCP family protein required for cell wall assembly
MNQQNQIQPKPNRLSQGLLFALLGAFVIAAGITAYLTYTVVRDLIASWELTSLPGVTIQEPGAAAPGETPGVPSAGGDITSPLQPLGGPTPQPWDGASRVNVLVMGLDYGDWAEDRNDPRTDTMILFTIDPLTRTAGMLSIPRDMWVNIPGYQYNRINTAYSLGEGTEYPGGGPGLAMATVSNFLGAPVEYYAIIDFMAFVRFVDEIGGVKLDIKEPITVDPIGDNNSKKLKPGRQTLPGDLALAYARTRKTEGGDFDRAQRTQQVILAIRDRILSADMLPQLISKAPVLYQELSSGVRTNLSLEQVIQLAWLAAQIPQEGIHSGAISPPDQVLLVTTSDGQQVLKPIADQIRLLRDDVFFGEQFLSPAVTGMTAMDLLKAEEARITLLNGTAETGLASRTLEYLQTQGIAVEAGNADQFYTNTRILDYTGKVYTVRYLADMMKVQPTQLYSRYDPTSPVDVVVILGADWAASGVLP